MSRTSRLLQRLGGLPAYLLTGPVLAGASLFESATAAPGGATTPAALTIATALFAAFPLARWAPLGGLGIVVASVAVPVVFLGLRTGGAQLIATMLLVGHAAYRLQTRWSALGYLGAALASAAAIVVVGESVWEFLFYTLILGPAWVVGLLLRREQERSAELARLAAELDAERERHAEAAAAAERSRISRELHDAVAHSVSVMTLQVGVVRRRLHDRPADEETLRRAELLGRQAVDELRRIVGLVREGEGVQLAPLPSLGQLEELLEQVRTTGTPVSHTVSGTPVPLPQALDMSAYRIVQEALTNALRHAPGAPVEVAVRYGSNDLALTVRNGTPHDGHHAAVDDHPEPGPAAAAGAGAGGNGVVGMHERVKLFGGRLEAGPSAAGGFEVSAWLPVHAAAGAAR
jgi:signal transduction histidine kinase